MSKVSTAKSKGKLTKKELKQDRLIEFTVKAESLYRQNRKWVIGVLAAVVLIVLAVVVITRTQKSAQLAESYQLTLAKMNYGAGRMDEARQAFQQIASQFGGKTAAEAKYFLGRIAFEQGEYASAEAEFSTYVKEYSVDGHMDAAAFSGLAASLEAQGKYDQAVEQLQTMADRYPENAYAPQNLLHVARIALNLNQPDRARQALKRIIEKYPESSAEQQARKELEALE